MKKSYVVYTTLITFLLVGCTQEKVPTFNIKDNYAQNLQYTKVKKVIIDNKVSEIIAITYLNSVDNKKWNDGFQNILISIYNDKLEINKNLLNITMNNNKLTSYKKVEKSNKIYENIAIKNRWSEYYILSYIDIKDAILSFKYNYNETQYIDINFKRF
ncbi:MAG: hypothetical protein U9Q30_09450 [Campylobacterota bacterium]|nr:hypothetical protein [Campylobacterota bacterium]